MNKRAPGFTLVEMLVVTLLGAVIMGSIYQMITIQDNTTRQQYAMIQNNQNARMTLAVLTSELKEMSARGGDVTYADSTILEFRALRKAAIACERDDGYIIVWNFGDAFAAGDSVLIFSDGASTSSMADDTWAVHRVQGVQAGNCATNPMGAPSTQRLNFAGNPLGGVQVGALVRSFVRTRYALADGTNGFGVINRTEGSAAAQPIIEGLATVAEGGLHMRFIDSTSAVIPYASLRSGGARLSHIMRVQVKVRGKSPTQVTRTSNRFTDSLVSEIYVRGNARGK